MDGVEIASKQVASNQPRNDVMVSNDGRDKILFHPRFTLFRTKTERNKKILQIFIVYYSWHMLNI